MLIDVSALHTHPDNPRKQLGDLNELTDSIRRNGIYQNLTVIPYKDDAGEEVNGEFTVIIGHRRLAAAKEAGLEQVPCTIVWKMSPAEQMQTMLLENMQRSDLTAYEQAQGFQMLLDFGDTVEQIAYKSGFSETTVRRRLKMAELDQDTLKKVSSKRQLSLTDFDELAKIKDINKRNELLKKIGTSEFNYNVTSAIKDEENAEQRERLRTVLNELGYTEILMADVWATGKYKWLHDYSFEVKTALANNKEIYPDNKNADVYYTLRYSRVEFYRLLNDKKTSEVVERKEAEQKRLAEIADMWAKVAEIHSLQYRLRKAFIDKLNVTKQNEHLIALGALKAATFGTITYSINTMKLTATLSPKSQNLSKEEAFNKIKALELNPKVVYALFNDEEQLTYRSSKESGPQYRPDYKLKLLYDWLVSLGYEMSVEERLFIDGSHAVWHQS